MASGSDDDQYKKINTFVFFDLETTGLICGNQMPRITEMAMVATARNSLRRDQRNKLALPRLLHKLTIPVCPMQPISPEASYITNLWNDTLENIKPFDLSTYNMMMQFIERLPGTVCFVAHNGNGFDYPVLLAEFERIGKTMPDNILCIDTLPAFQEFFSDVQPISPQSIPQNIPVGHDEVDEEELTALERTKSKASLGNDNWDDALYSALDEFDKDNRKPTSPSESGKDVLDSISHKSEKTVCDYAAAKDQQSPRSLQAANEKTPESQVVRSTAVPRTDSSNKKLRGVRKQLNFGDSKPKNFKLNTIYAHMIGREPDDQHYAESDCISMLRCICQIGPQFVEWADCNAASMNLFKREARASSK